MVGNVHFDTVCRSEGLQPPRQRHLGRSEAVAQEYAKGHFVYNSSEESIIESPTWPNRTKIAYFENLTLPPHTFGLKLLAPGTKHNNLVVPCNAAPRPWLWPNLLSLDAPVVAVLWQALFARCFHADVNALAAVLLVLAVWLIYAADRVFDAWGQNGGMPRHEFYRRHWRAVLPVWTAALAIAGWLAWTRLPSLIFKEGLVLLAAVSLYFTAVHLAPAALRESWHAPGALRNAWPKEAAVAVLFALGVSLAAWNRLRSAEDALSILLFCCLCWINCAAIDHWERPAKGETSVTSWPIGVAAMVCRRCRAGPAAST